MADKENTKTVARNYIVRNRKHYCSQCGTLLTDNDYLGYESYKCPNCGSLEMSNFGKVHKYLDEHGVSNTQEIYENTGVPTSEVNQFLQRSRLEISEKSNVFLHCEICGADIKSGRICDECAAKGTKKAYLREEIGDKPKSTGKMRFREEDELMLKALKRSTDKRGGPKKY